MLNVYSIKQAKAESVGDRLMRVIGRYCGAQDMSATKDEMVCTDHHISKIMAAVSNDSPIELLLPAFPAKSPNPMKTHSVDPDYGEVLALARVQKMCREIKDIYLPGAKLMICSDGHVFSDLVQVDDHTVTRYGTGISKIIQQEDFSHLDIFRLSDFFGEVTYDSMRSDLISLYGRSVCDVRRDVLSEPNETNLFNGIHRFVFEDLVVLEPGLSRNAARERAKFTAYQVIQRSHAWSELVQSVFPRAVRLSIHPQLPGSKKLWLPLVEGQSGWRTPWHGVVLKEGSSFSVVKKSEALAIGAKEENCGNGYIYFSTASA